MSNQPALANTPVNKRQTHGTCAVQVAYIVRAYADRLVHTFHTRWRACMTEAAVMAVGNNQLWLIG